MKDKDQKFLWEAYVSETIHSPENSCKDDEYYCSEDKVCKKKNVKEEAADLWPDGSKMDSERARHLDSLRARDVERDASFDVKNDVARNVKSRFDIDVEWHNYVGKEGGEWHRTDVPLPGGEESRPVTDDELEKIMIIEDPKRALERWPSLRNHPELFESTADEISGERWSEEGDEFEPGADDVDGYIMIDLYTGGIQTIQSSEVKDAVQGLEKIRRGEGETDWDVWKGEEYMVAAIPGKGGGDKPSWQDRAAAAGQKFRDEGGKMFEDER